MTSRSYSDRTLKILWARAAGRCALPGCRREVIADAKLWRTRQPLHCKTLWLELMVINARRGVSGCQEENFAASLRYLRDNTLGARIEDPSNSNIVISDDASQDTELRVALAANEASDATYSLEVFESK